MFSMSAPKIAISQLETAKRALSFMDHIANLKVWPIAKKFLNKTISSKVPPPYTQPRTKT